MGRLENKIALITGAAAQSRRGGWFIEEGATVVLTDVLDDLGRQTAAELGERASYLHLDVSAPISGSARPISQRRRAPRRS